MSEMNEYQRGFQDGRQHGDLLIHGKARNAYDTLTKAGLGDEAGAMWAEIARLQAIVCSACEASMDAGRDRDEAAEALAAERAAREAVEHAKRMWADRTEDAEKRAAVADGLLAAAIAAKEQAEAAMEAMRGRVEVLEEAIRRSIGDSSWRAYTPDELRALVGGEA